MKQTVKKVINAAMYRLFGHLPFPSDGKRMNFARQDDPYESKYSAFEVNSKPFSF